MPLSIAVASASSSTSREVAVIHIVGIAHERVAHRSEGLHRRQSDAITIVCSITEIGVGLQTSSGTSLGGEFQHEIIFSIINACQSREVTLLVIRFHLFDDIRRQVLHHGTVVARHEVTTIQLESLHILTIDGDASILVNLSARQRFHQCLNDRTLRQCERIGIINQSVILDHHLGDICCNNRFVKLLDVREHGDGAQRHVLTTFLLKRNQSLLITEECQLQQISAGIDRRKAKMSVLFRINSFDKSGVLPVASGCDFVELQRGAWKGFSCCIINDATTNGLIFILLSQDRQHSCHKKGKGYTNIA